MPPNTKHSKNVQKELVEVTSFAKNEDTLMIQDNPSLIKDLRSHAVVNRDNSAYTAVLESKRYHRDQRDEIKNLREKIDNLEIMLAKVLNINSSSIQE
jgi:hypothetical protein